MVMGHYTINIPENFKAFTLDSKIIDNSVFEVLIMFFFSSEMITEIFRRINL